METSLLQLSIVAFLWLGYFALHSMLASLSFKRWFGARRPAWMPYYRLGFNALSLLTLVPVLAAVYLWRGDYLWQWSGTLWWFANGLAVLAIAGFIWSLGFYDGDEFIGLRQLRERQRRVDDQGELQISPLHRYVRHPWYFLALVLIWTRDMDPLFLLSSVMMTLYFIIGSRLEERKLCLYYGRRYRDYCDRVAGLIPLPWRTISADEAERIMRGSHTG